MGEQKKEVFECYYSILGISQTASQADIKTAYRKLALIHHPDKNLSEDSHGKFIKIQKAFETLHDHQERSWYDQNRSSLMFNASEYMVDPSQYKNMDSFKGYEDDPEGFFSVFRNVFDEIINEEKIFSKNESEKFPGFGFSHSPFIDIVRPFYSYWSSFVTQKSFKWCDYYDCKNAINRAESRAMERENKPIRDNAKKLYNKNIRALVLYIKKRDPRILQMKQDELAKENTKTAVNLAKYSNGSVKTSKEYNWEKHYEEYHQDIDVIENLIDDQFCEKIDQLKIDKLEDKEFEFGAAIIESNSIVCLLCNCAFQSLKSFRNHAKTRNHTELYQAYKKTLNESEKTADKSKSPPTVNTNSKPDPTLKTNTEPTTQPTAEPSADPSLKNIPEDTKKPNILSDFIPCQVCGELFLSEDKLFDHMKEARHVAAKKVVVTKSKKSRSKKKKS